VFMLIRYAVIKSKMQSSLNMSTHKLRTSFVGVSVDLNLRSYVLQNEKTFRRQLKHNL